jgi:hypothetical protein
MTWPHFALDVSFHSESLSVVVFKVYVVSVSSGKPKREPPILVYLYGPRASAISLQFMQIEMRQADIFNAFGSVNHIQSITQTLREFRRHTSLAIGLEELA